MTRGDVHIGHGEAQQRIAHRAANIARHVLVSIERGEQPVQAGALPPIHRGQTLLHRPNLLRKLTRIAAVTPHMRRSRSEEHTSELQSLMRISYAVFCLKKKTNKSNRTDTQQSELTALSTNSTTYICYQKTKISQQYNI